jgi:hypothetical protein
VGFEVRKRGSRSCQLEQAGLTPSTGITVFAEPKGVSSGVVNDFHREMTVFNDEGTQLIPVPQPRVKNVGLCANS